MTPSIARVTFRLCCAAVLAAACLLWPAAAMVQAQVASSLSVDDSPAAEEMLRYANSLREQERYADAAASYQQAMMRYGQRLRAVEKGLYTDIRHWAQQQIKNDPQLLEAYRRRFEGDARHLLAEASKPQKPAAPQRPGFVATEPMLGPPVAAEAVTVVTFQNVLDQYYLTEAGLEAGLRLAGSQLEAGQPQQAATVLDVLQDHPGLAAHRQRWVLLQAAVGLFADDRERLAWSFNELREAGAADAINQLKGWATGLVRPERSQTISPVSPWLKMDLPDPLGAPLWQVPLPPPEQPITAEHLEQTWDDAMLAAQGGDTMHSIPMAMGDQLYMHLGSGVASLNRSSGQRQWVYLPQQEDQEDMPVMPALANISTLRFDPRAVATDGKSVVAVVGGLPRGQMRRRLRNGSTYLTSLRADDGSLRWEVEPSQLDASLNNTYFHGTPILSGGRLYVLARRQQGSGVHDAAFIVAVDAETGTLLWRRHLSSLLTQGNTATATLAEASLTPRGLFVIDQLGAVANIDPRSGGVRWLRLVDQPRAASSYPGRMQASPSPGKPVLVKAGLVVNQRSMTEAQGAVQLLNPDTGEVIKQFSGEPWSGVETIIEAPGGLIAIGPTVHMIDGEDLSTRWIVDLQQQAQAVGIDGRPAVTSEHLLLTAGQQFLAIRLDTGEVVSRGPVAGPGNVLAMPEQVVIAGKSAVRGYMNWNQALAHLQRAIDEHPLDPAPALALAHVAMSVNQPDAALAAADQALLALRRLETASAPAEQEQVLAQRKRVFDRLMTFAQSNRNGGDEIRLAMFDRAGVAAVSPAEQVAYRLSYGRFLEEAGRLENAVEQYQLVVQNESLHNETFRRDNVRRQAGLEARLRLVQLVREQGAEVYGQYEMQARQQLEQLISENTADVDALIKIAEQFPVAQAAGEALILAAERLEEAGHIHAAQARLRQAYGQVVTPNVLARVVGELVQSYQEHGRIDRARRWLARIEREHPGLAPLRDGKPVDPNTWLGQLAHAESLNPGRPSFYPPLDQPTVISGRLLLPTAQERTAWPHDRLVMLAGNSLQLRSGDELDVTWQYDVAGHAPELLSLTRTQVLLWFSESSQIVALDGETGAVQWGPLAVPALLDNIGDQSDREASRNEAQREFLKMTDNRPIRVERGRVVRAAAPGDPSRIQKAVNDAVVTVGDGLGRVATLSRRSGELLWQRLVPMDELNWIHLNDEAVVLAGTEGVGTHAPAGQMLVLDPVTGEERSPDIHESNTIRWIGLDEEGLLVYSTIDQLVGHQIGGGEAWRLAPQGADMGDRGWVGLGQVMVTAALEGQTNALLIVDAGTGALLSNWPLQPSMEQPPPLALESGDRLWHVLEQHRASSFGTDGHIRWADAINEPGKQLVMELLADRLAVVISRNQADRLNNPQRIVGQRIGEVSDPRVLQIYMLDIETGSLVAQRQVGPVPDPIDISRAMLLDNRLILTTSSEVVVIPGSDAAQGEAAPAEDDAADPPS